MSNEVTTKVKALDHVGGKYLRLREKRRAMKILEQELAQLEREIREEVGAAEEATIYGQTVITNRPINRFREKEFAADNPTLHKEYTRPVLVDQFQVDEFREAHPNLYAQYQSRQFRVLDV